MPERVIYRGGTWPPALPTLEEALADFILLDEAFRLREDHVAPGD